MLVANCKITPEIVPSNVLVHYFEVACKQQDFIPSEQSCRRIFHNVRGELCERRRTADRLSDFLLVSTEEIIEIHSKSKLKRFPPDLNRRDSQRVRSERIWVH